MLRSPFKYTSSVSFLCIWAIGCALFLGLGAGCGDSSRDSGKNANGDLNPAESLSADIEELVQFMTGIFDSSEQAADSSSYLSVQLQMCQVQAPTIGNHVLYVEQAMMSSLSSPYRQRLYGIDSTAEGTFVSTVYSLSEPQELVGLCSNNPMSRVFEPSEYAIKSGCSVALEKLGTSFIGGTQGDECSSTINGSTYATSEVSIFEDRIESWDRGFDGSDQQVWGSEEGAYIFRRQAPAESGAGANNSGAGPSPGNSIGSEALAGETCEDASDLRAVSTLNPAGSDYSHTVTASFGQRNDYNPYMESGMAPGCSPVYDAIGKDVVFAVSLAPGDTLVTRLELWQQEEAGIYILDDCETLSWPDVDESGMCGSSEYHSNGYCGYGCVPLEWSFQWPTSLRGLATERKTFFLVIDEVVGDSAQDFILEWSIIEED